MRRFRHSALAATCLAAASCSGPAAPPCWPGLAPVSAPALRVTVGDAPPRLREAVVRVVVERGGTLSHPTVLTQTFAPGGTAAARDHSASITETLRHWRYPAVPYRCRVQVRVPALAGPAGTR